MGVEHLLRFASPPNPQFRQSHKPVGPVSNGFPNSITDERFELIVVVPRPFHELVCRSGHPPSEAEKHECSVHSLVPCCPVLRIGCFVQDALSERRLFLDGSVGNPVEGHALFLASQVE
jgi:hypothetical protein